jgi:small subunit ribosomal protein S11
MDKVEYHLHVQATNNNTITTFTNEKGNTVATTSGGQVGFKGVNRSGYEAGYQCAVRIFRKVEQTVAESDRPISITLVLKGFGKGREAFVNALTMSEGERVRGFVERVTDKTPIKIGGTRAKKVRRF